MKSLVIIPFLLLFSTITFSQEKKLGDPIKAEFLNEFYGEEVTAVQEGTYSNVYANYEERYILYDMNLYRLAPQLLENEDVNTAPDVAKCIDWGYCFQPAKPLYWNVDLSRAARFHCNDMIVNNCFAHNDCDGGDIWKRIQRYYTSSTMGENIAAGSKYDEVTKNFINEKGAPLGTVGHRESTFSADFNEVGIGYLLGGSYRMYTTQDFGASATFSAIPIGIHEPKSPNKGNKVTFKAIYHGTTDNPKAFLIINNKIYPMNKIISNKDWNENNYVGEASIKDMNWYSIAYNLDYQIEEDCNKYSFLFIVDDVEHRYPDIGSLYAGRTCTELYDSEVVTTNETNNNNDGDNNNNNNNGGSNNSTDEGCSFGANGSSYLIFMFLVIAFISRKRLKLTK